MKKVVGYLLMIALLAFLTWGIGPMFKLSVEFVWAWRSGGPYDCKLMNPIYGSYTNYMYGATGEAAGFSKSLLLGFADRLHGGKNDPVNTEEIVSGFDAIASGGKLGIQEYNPTK